MAPNTVEPQGKGLENYGSHSLPQMQNWPLLSGKKYRASEQDQEWVQTPRMGKGGENLKEDRVTSRDSGLFRCPSAQEAGPAAGSQQ